VRRDEEHLMAKRSTSAKQRLTEYRKKRDFGSTPEPTGGEEKSTAAGKKKELYFCVQKHLASHLHYDFRLEHASVLLSWAVPKGPSLNPKDKRLAMRTEDHPFDYGDFEGVIPEGYGAGIVMLWDKGTWEPENGDVDAAIEKGEIKFKLNGAKLKGSWVIVRTGGRGAGDGRTWLLIKHRDDWAGDVDVTELFPRSVKSDGDFDDILAAKDPNVWESHRPAQGGAAGAMFAEIIERAARKKLEREESGARKSVQSKKTLKKSPKRTSAGHGGRRNASPTRR
jgi:bifunctional non-homologous end joining protein LigD